MGSSSVVKWRESLLDEPDNRQLESVFQKKKKKKKKTPIILTLLNSVLTETLNLTRQATTQFLLMNYYINIAQYIKGTSDIIERRILQPYRSSVYM